MAEILLDPNSIESYRQFLAIKELPSWRIQGRMAWFPDEYADRIGLVLPPAVKPTWEPTPGLWDYQRDITQIALDKRKYAVFADCGLGKTLILLEFAQAAREQVTKRDRGVLIVSPLMVVRQTLQEAERWYPGIDIEQVSAARLDDWMQTCRGKIGITNYDAIRPHLRQGQLGGMILDESSMLKSHYGKWGTKLIELGKGLDWKLCCTGTPAPNDRIEYANHAVFLDHYPTVNSFLATFFVNRGQTNERWQIKDHAIGPFYRALSHWCIFLTNPATYGWQDNCDTVPPILVNIHPVDLSDEQKQIFRKTQRRLFAGDAGGITTRSKMGQLAKGRHNGCQVATNKPRYIRDLVDSWPAENGLVWCLYNAEQEMLVQEFNGDTASITGATPHEHRMEIIDAFKAGQIRTLISKPKILGFGLNLQIATRQVFSGLQDSYESYYQAVKRSNRYGSTKPLNVHIPVTDLEEPMVQNVLRKAAMVQQDTEEQERIFKELNQ